MKIIQTYYGCGFEFSLKLLVIYVSGHSFLRRFIGNYLSWTLVDSKMKLNIFFEGLKYNLLTSL